MLIVTNGDMAAARLRALGRGEVLPWRDVLHEGPVTPAPTLEAQSDRRAAFLAEFSGAAEAEIRADLRRRDRRFLGACGAGDRVELWFEHDLYDQLQLAQILWAAGALATRPDLHLVQAGDHLTSLADGELAALAAAPVADGAYGDAAAAWAAFTAPAPDGLVRLAAAPSSLPRLPAALARLLDEYPDARSGLPRSLERAFAPLRAGPAPLGRLFQAMQAAEPAAFMGDLSFARMADEAAQAREPLIAAPGGARLEPLGADVGAWFGLEAALTAFGRAALAGEADHVAMNGVDRWIGGVHLQGESCRRRPQR